jgi:hypothetical protein
VCESGRNKSIIKFKEQGVRGKNTDSIKRRKKDDMPIKGKSRNKNEGKSGRVINYKIL